MSKLDLPQDMKMHLEEENTLGWYAAFIVSDYLLGQNRKQALRQISQLQKIEQNWKKIVEHGKEK